MDHKSLRDIDIGLDLESGGTTSEEDICKDGIFSDTRTKTLFYKICSGFGSFDGSIKREIGVNLCNDVPNSKEGLSVSVKMEGEANSESVETKIVKEKRKKMSGKKASKPPRPPKGPLLDAADQKLIREISELAMLKRARIERMKAMRKIKATKASSSNSSWIAMVFTIFFCLIIIFQGMSSRRSTSVSFPESSKSTEGGLISIQYFGNPSASETNSPGSASPSSVEQVSGSDPPQRMNALDG